jgi:hypothetical protein
MIGNSYSLKPSQSAFKPNPVAGLAGIQPRRTISDRATEEFGNNRAAEEFQKGYVRPAMSAKAGFSVNNMDRMRAAQSQASGAARGASAVAEARAEDQAFNSQQDFDTRQAMQARLNDNYAQDTAVQGSNFNRAFQVKSARMNNQMQRDNSWQAFRLSLLGNLG